MEPYPHWAETAFIGATKMADKFAARHILMALTAKWSTLALLPEGQEWVIQNQKHIIAYTGA